MSLNIQLEEGYKQIAGNATSKPDPVLYFNTESQFPVTGVVEKLYVDKSTGKIFTWSATQSKYVASGLTVATGISYDNTTSGLTKTNVQEAIDETVAKMNDIELFKFPNATIIGTPTINNGQVSGFSATSYMKFPFIVNMQGRPFTIDIAFSTGTDITNQQNIIDGIDHGIAFAIRSGKFIIVLGSKTGEWDISGGEKISLVTVQPQTTYRVRISWDGSVYKFEYSTNGESYAEDVAMRVSSSLSLFPTQINIGVTSGLGGIFTGIINMNYCSLTISDKIVWTGMDDVGLATRMAVDMSNIDDAGIEKVKSIIGDLPTKESLELNNVTNDKQVKGLSTGTTNRHLVTWGVDGYTVGDSGATIISEGINAVVNKDNVPTAGAVKTAIETATSGMQKCLGTVNALTELSTTAKTGEYYRVKTAWKAEDVDVHICDVLIAEKDNPEQKIDGANWSLLHNEMDTDTKYTAAENDPIQLNDTEFSHRTGDGYNHIPAAGATGNILRNNGEGSVEWEAVDTKPTEGSGKLITSDAVYSGLNDKLDKSAVLETEWSVEPSEEKIPSEKLIKTELTTNVQIEELYNVHDNTGKNTTVNSVINEDGTILVNCPGGSNTTAYNSEACLYIKDLDCEYINLWITKISGTMSALWIGFQVVKYDDTDTQIGSGLYPAYNKNDDGTYLVATYSINDLLNENVSYIKLAPWISNNNAYTDVLLKVSVTETNLAPANIPYNLTRTVLRKDIDSNTTAISKCIKQTEIVSVSSTANTVTVPENIVGDFAAIKMIGGKTVKSKNLLNPENRIIYPIQGNTSDGFSLNKYITTALTYQVKLKPNTSYTLSKTKAVGDRFRMVLTDVVLDGTTQGSQPYIISDTEIHTGVFTTGDTNVYCTVTLDNTNSLSVGDCGEMLEEGSEATEYEPYFNGLHSAPVESITTSNIITKPEFITITKYSEIVNRTGYIYESLKTGKYNVSVTNTGTKTAFVAVFRNNNRIESTYISISPGTTTNNVIYDIIDGDDIVIYQGSAINSDFITANVVSAGREPYTNTISISDIVKNLPDYGMSAGEVTNYIDFDELKYHHNVGSVDLGTLTVQAASTADLYDCSSLPIAGKTATINMITDKPYIAIASNTDYTNTDKSIRIASNGTTLGVHDSEYVDGALNDSTLIYELATPEVIDLKPFFPIISVEPNGSIEFVNEYNLDVPNTVNYKKEVM